MGAWEKLTDTEKHCYYFYGNGFKQIQISALKHISEGTIRTHLHSGKVKANCLTIEEALADFCRAGNIEKMHPDEKKKHLNELKRLNEKFPKRKKEK